MAGAGMPERHCPPPWEEGLTPPWVCRVILEKAPPGCLGYVGGSCLETELTLEVL